MADLLEMKIRGELEEEVMDLESMNLLLNQDDDDALT